MSHATLALALALFAPCAFAQNQPADSTPTPQKSEPETEQTIFLKNATAQDDVNDLQTALRNMFTHAKIYVDRSHNAMLIRGTAEDLESAKKMIAELDQPRRAYRVTFTITEMDGGKPTGSSHITLLVVEGEKTTLRQGNRIPLVTGMEQGASSAQNEQVQYIDVGLNIDASIDGDHLRAKIERTAVSDEKSGLGAADPIVTQVTLQGTSNLSAGNQVLGSLDIPQTTRHEEIAVLAERLK